MNQKEIINNIKLYTSTRDDKYKSELLNLLMPKTIDDSIFSVYTKNLKEIQYIDSNELLDAIKDIIIEFLYGKNSNRFETFLNYKPSMFLYMYVTQIREYIKDYLKKYKEVNKNKGTENDMLNQQSDFDISDFESGEINTPEEINSIIEKAFEFIKTQKVSQKQYIASYERVINKLTDKDIYNKHSNIFSSPQEVRNSISDSIGKTSKFSNILNTFIRKNSKQTDFDIKNIGKKSSSIYKEEFIIRLAEAVLNRIFK